MSRAKYSYSSLLSIFYQQLSYFALALSPTLVFYLSFSAFKSTTAYKHATYFSNLYQSHHISFTAIVTFSLIGYFYLQLLQLMQKVRFFHHQHHHQHFQLSAINYLTSSSCEELCQMEVLSIHCLKHCLSFQIHTNSHSLQ